MAGRRSFGLVAIYQSRTTEVRNRRQPGEFGAEPRHTTSDKSSNPFYWSGAEAGKFEAYPPPHTTSFWVLIYQYNYESGRQGVRVSSGAPIFF